MSSWTEGGPVGVAGTTRYWLGAAVAGSGRVTRQGDEGRPGWVGSISERNSSLKADRFAVRTL